MNYTLKSELGQGGMATVYLAHDNKFDTNVAVKVLNKELVNNENIRKRFIAEARKMFKMSHPNIIKVTDLIEEGDTVAFVMEYVEGETLKDYIDRKGKLSDEEIKSLFSQMLDAVGYVHEQNLVHRDIKPSNFMLDKKGQIKLMDFGIAKTTDKSSAEYTQTGTGVQMGTPMYMSPEQITETNSVTAQSDIYSLGVVLWQMVTGQKPYNTNTLSSFQLQTKIVNENLNHTDSKWDNFISKATAKNAENRFKNCKEFKTTLTHDNWEIDRTIVVDNHFTTVIENLKRNEKYENDKFTDLNIDSKLEENTSLIGERTIVEINETFVGKKLLMALTGLFLCTFLVVHLTGNLQLFKNDGGLSFNEYAVFMTTNPLIKFISYGLYVTILIHAFLGIYLVYNNKKARPVAYAQVDGKANSSWVSRNMGFLGTIILVFIVVHMNGFWAKYKFGEVPYTDYHINLTDGEITAYPYDGVINGKIEKFYGQGFERVIVIDLYAIVNDAFKNPFVVIFYIIAMMALAFHLIHGFRSVFQTLGLNHKKYNQLIKNIGIGVLGIIVPLLFAAMPIYFLLFN